MAVPAEVSEWYRELGRKGGRARALALSPRRRKQIARQAGLAGRGVARPGSGRRPSPRKSIVQQILGGGSR